MHVSLVDTAFDSVIDAGYSRSIKNKITIQGSAVDSLDRILFPTNADVYVNCGDSACVAGTLGTEIHEGHWEDRSKSNFFDIPVYCAPPLPLLEMKLAVSCESNGHPRDRDCTDIRNLVGVLEHKGISPSFLNKWISSVKLQRLKKIMNGECECYEEDVFLNCSEIYKRELLR
jgi:hypothetical protein